MTENVQCGTTGLRPFPADSSAELHAGAAGTEAAGVGPWVEEQPEAADTGGAVAGVAGIAVAADVVGRVVADVVAGTGAGVGQAVGPADADADADAAVGGGVGPEAAGPWAACKPGKCGSTTACIVPHNSTNLNTSGICSSFHLHLNLIGNNRTCIKT